MIGVSYRGIGGRTSSFSSNGGSDAMSELHRLQSESQSMMQRLMQRRGGGGGSAPTMTNEQRRQRDERDRQAKYDRLAKRSIFREGKKSDSPFAAAMRRRDMKKELEGLVDIDKIASKVDLDKIDPRRNGKDITGEAKSGVLASTTERESASKEPFAESYISDLAAEVIDGELRIFKFRRRRHNTGRGRVFAVSKEEPEFLCGIPTQSGGGGMFAWDEAEQTMGPGGCMVGRTWHGITPSGTFGDGTYYLLVTFLSDGTTTLSIVNAAMTTTDTQCTIPIYTISNGKVTADYRGAFVVPCWE